MGLFLCFSKAEDAVILAIAKFFNIDETSQSVQKITTFTRKFYVNKYRLAIRKSNKNS